MNTTLHNEPVTFDPAVREIAHEVSRLVARVRAALRPAPRDGWPGTENAV